MQIAKTKLNQTETKSGPLSILKAIKFRFGWHGHTNPVFARIVHAYRRSQPVFTVSVLHTNIHLYINKNIFYTTACCMQYMGSPCRRHMYRTSFNEEKGYENRFSHSLFCFHRHRRRYIIRNLTCNSLFFSVHYFIYVLKEKISINMYMYIFRVETAHRYFLHSSEMLKME